MILFLTVLMLFLVALYTWCRWIEPRMFEISRCDVGISKPLPFPLKILHLSDTHFTQKCPSVCRFMDRLAREEYDLVLISGDIIDSPDGVRVGIENILKLRSRLGVYAVLGNHDYYYYDFWDSFVHNFPGQTYPLRPQKVERFVRFLKKSGIRLLRNETAKIDLGGTKLLIHGLDDPTTGKANVRLAMKNFDRAKINLLLAHTIDVFLDIGSGEIDLAFFGHSHGGQIRLPWFGAIVTHTASGRKFASGRFLYKGAFCSVSRGVHSSQHWPIRLFCRPEAVILTARGKRQ